MATLTTKSRVSAVHDWHYVDIYNPTGKDYREADIDEARAVWSRPRPTRLTPTTMSVKRVRHNPRGYTDYYGWIGGSAPAFWRPQSVRTVTGDWPSEADKGIAQQRAAARFLSPDLDLGEGLTGLRHSYKMVAGRFGALASFLNNVRKHGARDAISATGLAWKTDGVSNTKHAANAYLETSFGWLQMASDAFGAASAIESGVGTKGTFVSGRATEYGPIAGLGSRGFAKVTLSGTISNPTIRTLNQLGLYNPALTAWQNVPLSFVADWFVGLSDALAYMTWGAGLSNRAMCYTRARVSTTEYKRSGEWVVWKEVMEIRRETSAPSFVWAGLMADRKISLSLGTIATSAALIAQRLTGR